METILIVDDDDDIRATTMLLIEEAGYIAVEASGGAEALKLIMKASPDLILCDIMMPDMDGYEVLWRVKSQPSTSSIPFIFLSAKNDRDSIRKGMDLGADDFLIKPFTYAEISKSVEAGLAKSKRASELSRQKLDELRQNISYALPHEMLTPLNGIIGASDMLIEMQGAFSPQEITDTLMMIRASGQRLYRLIRNTLLYAQLELAENDAEKIAALRRGNVEVNETLISEACIVKAKEYNRLPDVSWKCECCRIAIAQEHFQNIIEEILDNAFKFSAPGSPVKAAASVENGLFFLKISNYGRGMQKNEIEDIGAFMQFRRKLYEQQGSGLGLAITRQLAALHDGFFAVESAPNGKTTIIITLPLANPTIFEIEQ